MVWVVFDLDNTLILNLDVAPYLLLYKDTYRVLDFLQARGVIITLASFRTNVEEVLQQYNLDTYFTAVRFTADHDTDKRKKSEMIEELGQELGLSIHEAIFFDDLYQNVEECTNQLIHTVHVDPKTGITLELLFSSLLNTLLPPLYILSHHPLPEEEIGAYTGEYRVSFLTCSPQRDLAREISASHPTAMVIYVPVKSSVELFSRGEKVEVADSNVWKCLDEAVALSN